VKEKEYFVRVVLDYGISISAENKDKAYDLVCEMFRQNNNIEINGDEVVEITEQSLEDK
jgi:hypothetical protein